MGDSYVISKGGVSTGYKNYVTEKEIPDETYTEDGVALFRVQGSGPDNMQAIQVETAASSLNSFYCYILQSDSTVFTWSGSLTNAVDQELMERMLDLIKPNLQTKPHKEGYESEQFWELLGGKCEYPNSNIARVAETEPHLFACTFSNGDRDIQLYPVRSDDRRYIFILVCHTELFVWIGKQVDAKNRIHALTIGEKILEHDFLLEKITLEAPVYVIMEGSKSPFFTHFFSWDSAKFAMHGNSCQRKLSIVKNGGAPTVDHDLKPKRRMPVSYGGRSSVPDKSQRSRSMSFSPDKVRVRGRSPAFNALASKFDNANTRNLSTPPPMVRKIYPKLGTLDSAQQAAKSNDRAALTTSFEKSPLQAREVSSDTKKQQTDDNSSMSSSIESLAIEEDVKEGEAEDDEGLPTHLYERLKIGCDDPAPEIDVTKREAYLSSRGV